MKPWELGVSPLPPCKVGTAFVTLTGFLLVYMHSFTQGFTLGFTVGALAGPLSCEGATLHSVGRFRILFSCVAGWAEGP